MSIREKIRDLVVEHAAALVVALLATGGALLAPILAKLLAPFVAEAVTPVQWSKLVLVLAALLFFAIIFIVVLYLKNANPSSKLLKRYEHIETLGIYRNKETNAEVCTSCLLGGVESPLQVLKHGWQCHRKECHKFYSNPNYNAKLGRLRTDV